VTVPSSHAESLDALTAEETTPPATLALQASSSTDPFLLASLLRTSNLAEASAPREKSKPALSKVVSAALLITRSALLALKEEFLISWQIDVLLSQRFQKARDLTRTES
jgi:hypothetical protein